MRLHKQAKNSIENSDQYKDSLKTQDSWSEHNEDCLFLTPDRAGPPTITTLGCEGPMGQLSRCLAFRRLGTQMGP